MKKFVVIFIAMFFVALSVNALTEKSEKIRGPDLSGQFASNTAVINDIVYISISQNFVMNRSDMMLSPQGFVFTTSTANTSPDLTKALDSSSSLNTTMLTITTKTGKAEALVGGNVIWPVSNYFLTTNPTAEMLCNGPIMVLKKPLQGQYKI